MLPKLLFYTVCFFLTASSFAQFNPNLTYGEVKDVEGNTYKTIQIGTQTWMAENLRTTKYNNGTPIENITDDEEWYEDETGAWCYYENDESNNKPYGKLYNWYAVTNNNQICPKGWHVPTDEEWTILTDFLGGFEARAKMKSKTGWKDGGNGTNSSGLSGLPGGIRGINGSFLNIGYTGYWWSSTEYYNSNYAWFRYLNYRFGLEDWYTQNKTCGFSVRCIKD